MNRRKFNSSTNQGTNIKETYLNLIYGADWKEPPVDVLTFVSDPLFLGGSTDKGELIYPKWKEALRQMFVDNTKTFIVLTGCAGGGKSTVALCGISYITYLLLSLRNPQEFFGIDASTTLGISFFNLSRSKSASLGFNRLQTLFYNSPWFRRRARHIHEGKNVVVELPGIEYILSSPYSSGSGVQGAAIVTGILDEVDAPHVSTGQKQRVIAAYNNTAVRFETRFVRGGKSLGKLFIVSSKQDELGFIDTYIAEKKNTGRTLVFDYPLWDLVPSSNYSGKKFKVANPGDAFHLPRIIHEGEEVAPFIEQGYEILEVPIENYDSFKADIVTALRDIAGRTVHSAKRNKFFRSEVFITECFDPLKPDPVKQSTIHLGLRDQDELMWYLDLAKCRLPKNSPRYIHMDFGLVKDALSLACSCPRGYIEVDAPNPDGTFSKQKQLVVETEWVMRIKARDNDEIPLAKVNKLIVTIKQAGFRIKKFTSDLRLASAGIAQVLSGVGIPTDYLSVDKTDEPYMAWRGLVYDKRWTCHSLPYLLFEAKNLIVTPEGKIDHPDKVQEVEFLESGEVKEVVVESSKDMCDAVCGSVYSCLVDSPNIADMGALAKIINKISTQEPSTEDEVHRIQERLLTDGQGRSLSPKPDDIARGMLNIMKRL